MTALFESIIFGPIQSRRLGVSLGVNLLPQHSKICTFDCIYCECGSNSERKAAKSDQHRFAQTQMVIEALEQKLSEMKNEGAKLDVITFAGNGEPTLHPDFEAIINKTLELRDTLAPTAKISVLSNATNLGKESVVRALKKVENNILKLDSAIETTAKTIDRPTSEYSTQRVIEQLKAFNGECIIQTMFLRGVVDGFVIDNTTQPEITAWLEALKTIAPKAVMIYSIDRDTPYKELKKITKKELMQIAQRVEKEGFPCNVA